MSGAYGKTWTANPGGDTVRQSHFAEIPAANIERSVFNRSCGLKTAFNAGYLVPILCDEALPGDTFSMRTSSMVRMTTPLFPLLDNLYMDLFFFAVPIRLIWNSWQKFNGEQVNPGDSTAYSTPIFNNFTPTENSLSDYLGILPGVAYNTPNNPVCSFWHRAYNLIFNEWFRDENLVNSSVVDKDDGPDDIADYVLLRRGKRHDYFTSSLPFTQKGTPVTLTTTIVGTGAPTFTAGAAAGNIQSSLAGPNANVIFSSTAVAPPTNLTWSDPKLGSSLGTINSIREAFQVQRLLERDARGGSRYTEIIRSHFGVISPDQRLQRPEYLGGGSARINVHPIAKTSDSGASSMKAFLGGFATAAIHDMGFHKSFVEHCVVIGLVNVRADITYQQGLNRMFSRRTRYDFYWPAFAHLGEQAVLNKEIYTDSSVNDIAVWGYQERYAEYRYKPNTVTGSMRSSAAAPMDAWHLGLKFTVLPALNSTFIPDQPPMSRILAVATQPDFFGDFWFDYKCARPMPTFSVPGLVDHF